MGARGGKLLAGKMVKNDGEIKPRRTLNTRKKDGEDTGTFLTKGNEVNEGEGGKA